MEKQYSKYVFFTESISSLGGAQLLVLRRAKYLLNQGVSVKVIVRRHQRKFFLKEKFKNIPVLYLPDFELPFSLVGDKRKEDLQTSVKLFLGDISECILETHSLRTAIWGEFLASKLNLKHIIYFLNERPIESYRLFPGKKLYDFKYKRGELFGCSSKSLEIIFDKNEEGFTENFINVSFDPNELSETCNPPLDINTKHHTGIVISTLSRLEKGYIRPLIYSCTNFANNNPDKHITLIIAGGSENASIEKKLKLEFLPPKTDLKNLHIIFTGYILSLGKDFFQMTDIFVGMGTASINAISQGCATINIEPNTNKTSGIFGVDTNNFAYSENNVLYEIEEKLSSLVCNPELLMKAQQEGRKLFYSDYTTKTSFDRLNYLLGKSEKNRVYFSLKTKKFYRLRDFILFYIISFRVKLNTWSINVVNKMFK